MTPIRRGRLAAVLTGALAACGLAAQSGVSQDEKAKPPAPVTKVPTPYCLDGDPAPKNAGKLNASIAACTNCHRGGQTDTGGKDDTPGQAGQGESFIAKYKSDKFIRMVEAGTWLKEDVHSVATRNIDPKQNPIADRMQKAYHAAYGADHAVWKDITKAAQCLTCHSVDLTPDRPFAEKRFTGAAEGVNCTACHGLGYNWQNEHYADPEDSGKIAWRTQSPAFKHDYGMADLRNPAVKGKMCATCHVGSPELGRVVTHEMYAVGHPPLPPIELAAFMENEPKHWAYPTDPKMSFFKEFADANKEKTWATFRYHPADQETYQARNIAVGAIAALEAEARLLAAGDDPQFGGGSGLDYARFDCYACHHDLRYPSYRQDRGYEAAPGRPTLKAWSGLLPAIVAEHAAGLEDEKLRKLKDLGVAFKGKWEAVRKAATDMPYGNVAAVKTSAKEIADWCASFLRTQTEITTPVYTPEQSKKLAAMIRDAATGPRWSADPETALVLTWAYTTLRADMKAAVPDAQLAALDQVLSVKVREPKNYTDPKTKRPPVLHTYLTERMTKFNGFDPAKFRELFPKPAN